MATAAVTLYHQSLMRGGGTSVRGGLAQGEGAFCEVGIGLGCWAGLLEIFVLGSSGEFLVFYFYRFGNFAFSKG